jgi:hypothetical protein
MTTATPTCGFCGDGVPVDARHERPICEKCDLAFREAGGDPPTNPRLVRSALVFLRPAPLRRLA